MVTNYTYTTARNRRHLNTGDSVVVATHDVDIKLNTNRVIATKTGQPSLFTGKGSWAIFSTSTPQITNPQTYATEYSADTTVARITDVQSSNENTVACFLQIDRNNEGISDFNRWGWCNRLIEPGSYIYNICAGCCHTSQGVMIGTLTVNYNGLAASVTFRTSGANPITNQPYKMIETRLYAGNAILPYMGTTFTTPGSYASVHTNKVNGITTDTHMISGLSGNIYVVAQATIKGFPLLVK